MKETVEIAMMGVNITLPGNETGMRITGNCHEQYCYQVGTKNFQGSNFLF